jgi:hypothetical protein
MKRIVVFLIFISSLFSCKKEKEIQLNFLSEYVLKDTASFKNKPIGGLSGLDYSNGFYYFVVDDTKAPRFLKGTIEIEKRRIAGINFEEVIVLKDSNTNFYNQNTLDLESIFVDEEKQHINFLAKVLFEKEEDPLYLPQTFLGNLFLSTHFQKACRI